MDSAVNKTSSAKNSIESLGGKISGVGDQISSVGSSLNKKVTLPLAGLATTAVTVTAGFESGMSSVAAISGATGEDLEKLSKKAQEMGATTKFSASEAADALKYMAMAGWKTDDMLNGIEGIMSLAAASGEDLATTSDIVTDALTAFGLSAEDSTHFADVLAVASNNANTNVSMMGETFKYVAPIAGALGYSVEDTAEAIGLLANSGIKASQAGTTLRTMMTKLQGDIKISSNTLGDFVVQTTNSDGSMRELTDILNDCRKVFSQLSESEQASAASSLVGQEAMSGFLALMNASPEDINKLRGALEEADGTASDMADTMQDNLTGQLTILKSTLESVAISFGELLLPLIKEGVSWLQSVAEWINNLDDGQKEMILRIAGVAAVVGPVILILGKLTNGIGNTVGAVGKVVSVFNKFTGAASTVAAPAQAASTGLKAISKSAINLLAAGAGILMAAGGLALLANAAVTLAEAGWPAIAVLGGLVAALALLAVGAAAIGPALTAGSVGLLAFGGTIALVGAGVLAASAGVALLATQLPTISKYGAIAGEALLSLGDGLLAFGGGAAVAGAGLLVIGYGLITVGAGAAAAAVGIAALGAGVLVVAVGVVTLGAGLTLCGAGLSVVSLSAKGATSGLLSFAEASAQAFIPITAGALACTALELAIVPLLVELGLLTVELGLSSAAGDLLALALGATALSVVTIKDSAKEASTSLKDLVSSVDVTKQGLNGFGNLVDNVVDDIVGVFTESKPKARQAATELAEEMEAGVQEGFKDLPEVIDDSLEYISTIGDKSYTWGSDIIRGLSSGISSNLGTLQNSVNRAANTIYSRLHFSRPDEGPLKDYESWMPDFMTGLASGIDANSYRVETAIQGVASKMEVKPEYTGSELFTAEDTSNLKEYNVTLVNTLEIYRQLVEQLQLYSQYSMGIYPQDNGLLQSQLQRNTPDLLDTNQESDDKNSDDKPDQLVIPINIGEEALETVVVDLLKREVRT